MCILGEAGIGERDFELLAKARELSGREIPAGLRGLDRKEIRHRSVCVKEAMPQVVREILNK